MGVWTLAEHKSEGNNGALVPATSGLKVTLLCLVQTVYALFFKSETHVMLFMFPQSVSDSWCGALLRLVKLTIFYELLTYKHVPLGAVKFTLGNGQLLWFSWKYWWLLKVFLLHMIQNPLYMVFLFKILYVLNVLSKFSLFLSLFFLLSLLGFFIYFFFPFLLFVFVFLFLHAFF